MNTEEYITDFMTGKRIGIIETCPNGDQIARMWDGRQIVGFYRAKYNHTTDFVGRIIGNGNRLSELIFKNLK